MCIIYNVKLRYSMQGKQEKQTVKAFHVLFCFAFNSNETKEMKWLILTDWYIQLLLEKKLKGKKISYFSHLFIAVVCSILYEADQWKLILLFILINIIKVYV